jgi:hypothetical protein
LKENKANRAAQTFVAKHFAEFKDALESTDDELLSQTYREVETRINITKAFNAQLKCMYSLEDDG